jgi:hypothetical protein
LDGYFENGGTVIPPNGQEARYFNIDNVPPGSYLIPESPSSRDRMELATASSRATTPTIRGSGSSTG